MNILLFFICIIINPIRLGEKFTFSEEVREKHIGFREVGQEKFVLLKQKSGEFFQKVRINAEFSQRLLRKQNLLVNNDLFILITESRVSSCFLSPVRESNAVWLMSCGGGGPERHTFLYGTTL